MIKIAHMADIHIRNLIYHKEYKAVFSSLYEKLKEEKVDIIYVGGDLAHTKTQLSPEYFDLCSDFLSNLGNIAPTYVILGNHDGNLRSTHRQDAVTPIVEALQHPGVHLLKNSGETIVQPGLVFNVLSIFDEDNWTDPTDPDAINIAFYHGPVSGCKTDVGWTLHHGDNDVSIFEEFDFAMLGDIHKTNQTLDEEGRVRYCGSLIQQNHGETNDKGFLLWEIESKDDFTVRHIRLENPTPFITIELTKKGRMPKNIDIPQGARLRLLSNNNLPVDKMKRAVDVAKSRFKPEAITFLNRALEKGGDGDEFSSSVLKDDLRDIKVQERLIREYLEDYELEEETVQKVFDLNRKYNSIVEENEEISRNVNWKLKSIEWDNLFNYGEDNKINFENLDGIVGIFGKNYSGKSSIIDSILFTIFNSTSKNERKNLNVINQNKETGSGRAVIAVNDCEYVIERNCEKYLKRLKGEETLEAKTELSFDMVNQTTSESIELNGLTRNETDKKIRKMFGSLEDFLYSSMSSQLGALSFIGEGSTRRKEILAKFLDLEIFERKFKLAKEDASDLRGALKRIEGREFDNEIFEVEKEIIENEAKTRDHQESCKVLQADLELKQQELGDLIRKIESMPAEVINIIDVRQQLAHQQDKKDEHKNQIETHEQNLDFYATKLAKAREFLDQFDIELYRSKEKQISQTQKELDDLISTEKDLTQAIQRKQKKVGLLAEVPCGDLFTSCKFIKDAHTAKVSITGDENSLATLRLDKEGIYENLQLLNPDQTLDYIQKHTKLLENCKTWQINLSKEELEIEKNQALIKTIEHKVGTLKEKIKEYEDNKEVIENLEGLTSGKLKTQKEIDAIQKQLDVCNQETLELYKSHGSLEQKLANLKEKKQELETLRQEHATYDLYQQCMKSSGISYDIIKKKLPVINNEIAKVLTSVVDFEVFFEEESKRLNIFIKHPKFDARPLEMGSGAEKTIAAMAIRLALLSVSNLPKPSLFILDEPGTALDESNMEGFVRILDMVKSYFKTVLLISHLDSLKDIVDMQISIEKNGEYAHVRHAS